MMVSPVRQVVNSKNITRMHLIMCQIYKVHFRVVIRAAMKAIHQIKKNFTMKTKIRTIKMLTSMTT